jgi:hypothetical protein
VGARLLTPAEVRAEFGALVDGLPDAALEEIARRVRVVSLTVLAQLGASKPSIDEKSEVLCG